MTFAKRCNKRWTDVAIIKEWRALDAPYAVMHTKSLFDLPPRWLAVFKARDSIGTVSYVISRHRNRHTAVAACEKHWKIHREFLTGT